MAQNTEGGGKAPRKKHSFDAEGKAAEILERVEGTSLKKGRFICLCIEIAEQQAYDALLDEINERRKGLAPNSGKRGK